MLTPASLDLEFPALEGYEVNRHVPVNVLRTFVVPLENDRLLVLHVRRVLVSAATKKEWEGRDTPQPVWCLIELERGVSVKLCT